MKFKINKSKEKEKKKNSFIYFAQLLALAFWILQMLFYLLLFCLKESKYLQAMNSHKTQNRRPIRQILEFL